MSAWERLVEAMPHLAELSAETKNDESLKGKSDPQGWNGMPDGQPRTCATCGERVVLGAEPVWFKTNEPLSTWHMRCKWDRQ